MSFTPRGLLFALIALTVAVLATFTPYAATTAHAATTTGDIAIISLAGDNPDEFSFVALAEITAGTEIFFTDNGWNDDDTFRNNEGVIKYTAPSNISVGTVITFENDLTGDFSSEDAGFALATNGDQVLAYIGSSASPTFIFAVQSNSTEWQTDADTANDSALPQGLTDGVNAVAAGAGSGSDDEFDNIWYSGTTTGTTAELLAAIADDSNWEGSNDRSDFSPVTANFTVICGSVTVSDQTGLDAAITDYNNCGDGETYLVTVDGTITYSSSLTTVNNATTAILEIVGDGDDVLDGDDNYQLLNITDGEVSIDALTLQNGSAGNGAAIFNDDDGVVTITDTTLTDNVATSGGGAIRSNGTMTITSSTIANNSASGNGGDAGGIYNFGTMGITNTTITGNEAGRDGGGIYADNLGTITITNSTIVNNAGGTGTIGSTSGGIVIEQGNRATLNNNIIANNTFDGSPNDCYRSTGSVNFSAGTTNLIENDDSGQPCGTEDADYFSADPDLGDLADNGGNVQTMLPDFDSVVLNAGDSTTAPSEDARGISRPEGLADDLGAVEVEVPDCQDYTITDQDDLETAILAYNLSCDNGETLTATIDGTITYSSSLTTVNNTTTAILEIVGDGDDVLDGDDNYQLLNITDGEVAIDMMTLQKGRAGRGGAIFNDDDGVVTITDTTLTDNVATSGGGAIRSNGTMTITSSTIANNSASGNGGDAGGIYNFGTMEITNTTITGNEAGRDGGGIYADNDGIITITNSTIVNNAGGTGPLGGTSGGIVIEQGNRATLNNNIIANNTFDGSPNDCYRFSTAINFSSGTTNIIENDDSGKPCGTAGSNYITDDPVLGSLADNGGPVQTMALLIGSPAIDVGDSSTAPAEDARGITRPQFTADDLGAYEIDTLTDTLILTIDTDSISENGGTSTATIRRNSASGSLTVSLASSDTGEATVPASVSIADGESETTFTVTAVDDTVVDGNQTVTITASAAGFADVTDTIDIVDDELSLTIVADSISENGGTTTATVTRADTDGEITVNLSSDDTGEATVPASITIVDGDTDSAAFTITAVDDGIVDSPQTVTITASATNYADGTDTVDVTPECADVTVSSETELEAAITIYNAICGNGENMAVTVNGTITLSGALSEVDNNTTAQLTIQGDGDDAIDGDDTYQILDISSSSEVTIDNLTLQNGADSGGGGAIETDGTLTVTNSTFSGNATTLRGGAIFTGTGTVTVANSTFSGNSADSDGGAIHVNFGTTTIINSTFTGNSGVRGSAVSASNGTMNVINSTLTGNISSSGSTVFGSFATLNVTNSTIADNVAADTDIGAGIYTLDTLNLSNSIVSGSVDSSDNPIADCYLQAGTINFSTGTSNIIETDTPVSSRVCGTAGTDYIQADPDLGALADNGGDVQTMLPANTSPVIDAGDNASALDETGTTLTTDARGEDRIQNLTVDLGAVETSPPAPTFAKAFSTSPVRIDDVVTLTFTITNTAAIDATSLDFTDNLPANLAVATTPNVSTTCTGGTITAVSGTSSINYTGGTVSASSSCTVQVDVAASANGSLVNTSEALTSSLGTSGTATDTLVVEDQCQAVTVSDQTGLEAAIVEYNNNCRDGETLTATVDGTITLGSALSTVSNSTSAQLIVQGDGDDVLDGADSFRILNITDGDVIVDNLTLQNGNTGGNGGAILNTATLTVSNSTLTGNQAAIAGGILSNGANSELTVTNSTISQNEITSFGGGIVIAVGTATIENSTIASNVGGQTAGMQIQSGATVDIINSTIADNGTSGVYGGLIVNSSDTTVTLTNSTVSGNVAGSGMVLITNSAVLNLNNSILANGNGGSDCTNNGGTVNFSTGTSNLIESNSSGFSCGTAGTNFIEADPELSTLADNGGNVQTLLPADTSPVINAGDNASALDASGSPLTTDARGESRFIGTVDLGAVELPQIATIEFTAADTSGAESTANPLILTLTTTDGAATEAAFTVTLAVTPGTATLTDDYTFNTSFMVPAGTASGTPFAIPNTDFAVVDDTRYEPDETLTLALSSPSSGAVLGTVGSTTYTITNDDAIPVVTVAPAGPITLDEATTQAQVFTFTADTAPLADVTIPISVSSTACETNATEVVLTAANYLTGAVVTVTAIDNAIADPDQRCDLVTGDTTSTDVAYEAVGADDVADVEITIVDDELAQVFVTPTGLATLSETGPELQDFTFTLSTEPTTEVNIPLATSSTECVLSIDTVTIDNTTWETGVSVTVTAVDDIIAEVTEACNLWTLAPDTTDTGYGALTAADVPNRLINITDNDTASITLSPEQSGRITLNEDDTTGVTYTFTLGTEPEANVTIPLVTSSDACTVSSDSVVLDSTNYATGVSFTVVPVDNLLDDGDRVCNLWTLAPASTDAAYDAFTATDTPNRLITIVDDEETPGILISPSAAQELLEAGEQSIDYTVTLASEPSAAVTFSASMSSSECTLTGSPVVLDSSNWNTGVSLTVQAIDDGINDGNQACNLWTLDPSSSDPLYDGLTATDTPNRFITIIDNPSVDDVLNLIENGAFNTPIGSEWSQSGNITADNPSGELEMTLTQTDGVAIIEQNTGVAASSGTILSAELQLGNTGSETKQVRVNLLNTNSDGSIGEVKACIFYVPGNTALETYTLTTSINNNWSNTTFRIALRESTEPALLVDNVVVEVRPDLSVNGTTCTPASRLSRSVSPTALDLSAMPVVEEVTEAQAAAAPAAGAAPVETEEAAVTIEEPVVEATPTVTEEATVEQTEPVADATPDVTEEALPTLDVEEVTTDESFTEVTPEVAPVEEAAVVEETVEEAAVPVTEVSAEVGTTGE